MKNFNFRPKQSVIKTLKEPPKDKQKFNWQRWMWMGILCAIIGSFIYRVFDSVAVMHGMGQVELQKQAVTFTDDIKVLDIAVQEGQEICQGDTLFYFRPETAQDEEAGNIITIQNNEDWIIKEKWRLKQNIKLKKIQRNSIQKLLGFKKKELQSQKELILLGVNQIESTLSQIQATILRQQEQMQALTAEIKVLQNHLALLREEEAIRQQLELAQQQEENAIRPYLAQMDGIIGRINFSPNEVCYEKQDVMTIHQTEAISIRAYFDPEMLPHVTENDLIDIEFPDGSTGQGIVHNFYVSTYALPSEFQKKYEPTTRNVVSDIHPITAAEGLKWVNFYKMPVKISKFKL